MSDEPARINCPTLELVDDGPHPCWVTMKPPTIYTGIDNQSFLCHVHLGKGGDANAPEPLPDLPMMRVWAKVTLDSSIDPATALLIVESMRQMGVTHHRVSRCPITGHEIHKFGMWVDIDTTTMRVDQTSYPAILFFMPRTAAQA